MGDIAPGEPSADLCFKGRLIFDADQRHCLARMASSASAHVEPASVFGRVVSLESLCQTLCFLRLKGYVEKGGRMGDLYQTLRLAQIRSPPKTPQAIFADQ
jgi:hypothetical protein